MKILLINNTHYVRGGADRVYTQPLVRLSYLEPDYHEFNIGSGVNTNLKYILKYIKKITLSKSVLEFGALPYRKGELMSSNNDISKIEKLGWSPKISIEEGINNVIKSFK